MQKTMKSGIFSSQSNGVMTGDVKVAKISMMVCLKRADMIENLKIEKIKDVKKDRAFKNLQQFYEFEFSCVTKSETNGYAEYEQQKLISAWCENGFDAYIITLEQKPIGFAVVNLNSMINGDVDVRDMAEFFILPLYRRGNNGKYLAHKIFDMYEGQWEVRQLPSALKAREFWLKVIKDYVGDNFIDEKIYDLHWGEELFVQKFKSKKKGS